MSSGEAAAHTNETAVSGAGAPAPEAAPLRLPLPASMDRAPTLLGAGSGNPEHAVRVWEPDLQRIRRRLFVWAGLIAAGLLAWPILAAFGHASWIGVTAYPLLGVCGTAVAVWRIFRRPPIIAADSAGISLITASGTRALRWDRVVACLDSEQVLTLRLDTEESVVVSLDWHPENHRAEILRSIRDGAHLRPLTQAAGSAYRPPGGWLIRERCLWLPSGEIVALGRPSSLSPVASGIARPKLGAGTAPLWEWRGVPWRNTLMGAGCVVLAACPCLGVGPIRHVGLLLFVPFAAGVLVMLGAVNAEKAHIAADAEGLDLYWPERRRVLWSEISALKVGWWSLTLRTSEDVRIYFPGFSPRDRAEVLRVILNQTGLQLESDRGRRYLTAGQVRALPGGALAEEAT